MEKLGEYLDAVEENLGLFPNGGMTEEDVWHALGRSIDVVSFNTDYPEFVSRALEDPAVLDSVASDVLWTRIAAIRSSIAVNEPEPMDVFDAYYVKSLRELGRTEDPIYNLALKSQYESTGNPVYLLNLYAANLDRSTALSTLCKLAEIVGDHFGSLSKSWRGRVFRMIRDSLHMTRSDDLHALNQRDRNRITRMLVKIKFNLKGKFLKDPEKQMFLADGLYDIGRLDLALPIYRYLLDQVKHRSSCVSHVMKRIAECNV